MGNDEIKKIKATKYYQDLTNKNNVISNPIDNLHEEIKLSFFINNCQMDSKYYFTVSGNNNQLLLSTKPVFPKNNNELIFDNSLIMTFYFEKEQKLSFEFYINNKKFIINITLGQIAGSRNNTFIYKFENLQEILSIKMDKLEETKKYLNIQFYDFKKKIVGDISLALEDFSNKTNNINNTIQLNLSKKRTLILTNKSFINEKYTFIDYLKSGVRLSLSIGIDFTGSNGNPLDEVSLHRISEGYKNDYENAIYSCGNIIAYYDYDQLFPVYGFGAIINNSNNKEVNHCFPINFNYENPYIYTIPNVINVYHQCLNYLTFSGPTYFSPIINDTIKIIKNNNNNLEYHVLMILTDGIINDMNETIDALVEGSFLPLSVIIIGIGNANFENMKDLDADDKSLISSKGVESKRDLVQFVPFSEFHHDGEKLAEKVLEEIPRQIEDYYSLNNLYPKNIQK